MHLWYFNQRYSDLKAGMEVSPCFSYGTKWNKMDGVTTRPPSFRRKEMWNQVTDESRNLWAPRSQLPQRSPPELWPICAEWVAALWLGRKHLCGPALTCGADALLLDLTGMGCGWCTHWQWGHCRRGICCVCTCKLLLLQEDGVRGKGWAQERALELHWGNSALSLPQTPDGLKT